jgi:hypothetical protein
MTYIGNIYPVSATQAPLPLALRIRVHFAVRLPDYIRSLPLLAGNCQSHIRKSGPRKAVSCVPMQIIIMLVRLLRGLWGNQMRGATNISTLLAVVSQPGTALACSFFPWMAFHCPHVLLKMVDQSHHCHVIKVPNAHLPSSTAKIE